MSWKECDPMQERVQFVMLCEQGHHSIVELCDLFHPKLCVNGLDF
jgi:hypothetical protein